MYSSWNFRNPEVRIEPWTAKELTIASTSSWASQAYNRKAWKIGIYDTSHMYNMYMDMDMGMQVYMQMPMQL